MRSWSNYAFGIEEQEAVPGGHRKAHARASPATEKRELPGPTLGKGVDNSGHGHTMKPCAAVGKSRIKRRLPKLSPWRWSSGK